MILIWLFSPACSEFVWFLCRCSKAIRALLSSQWGPHEIGTMTFLRWVVNSAEWAWSHSWLLVVYDTLWGSKLPVTHNVSRHLSDLTFHVFGGDPVPARQYQIACGEVQSKPERKTFYSKCGLEMGNNPWFLGSTKGVIRVIGILCNHMSQSLFW